MKITNLEASKEDPLTYQAFGVRTVHKMVNDHETISKLVEQYHIRLVGAERSADNPDGLMIGEYWSKQIEGEKREAVLDGTPGSEDDAQQGGNQ